LIEYKWLGYHSIKIKITKGSTRSRYDC